MGKVCDGKPKASPAEVPLSFVLDIGEREEATGATMRAVAARKMAGVAEVGATTGATARGAVAATAEARGHPDNWDSMSRGQRKNWKLRHGGKR